MTVEAKLLLTVYVKKAFAQHGLNKACVGLEQAFGFNRKDAFWKKDKS